MSHYYVNDPNLKEEKRSFDYCFCGEHFTFTSDNGVFSKDSIDYGSYLLLKYTYQNDPGESVLDLGCGYGPIGIIMKRFHPHSGVIAVDVNERAVELTKINAQQNAAEISTYITDDISTLNKTYNTILLNPPIRAGKAVIYDLYDKAFNALLGDGVLYVVIRRQHGAESSIKKLKELFNEVEVLGKEAGYWILRASKSES